MTIIDPCKDFVRVSGHGLNEHLPDSCLVCEHVNEQQACPELARRFDPLDRGDGCPRIIPLKAKGGISATLD